jgi:hypothetical protein
VLGRVRVPVGFCKWVSFGGFQGFFRFLSGFEFFFGVFRLLSVSGFFGFRVFSGVFWVSGAPMGKNGTHTQTWFYAGRVRVTDVKMHPNPSGAKLVGYLKSEPELSSLSNIAC